MAKIIMGNDMTAPQVASKIWGGREIVIVESTISEKE